MSKSATVQHDLLPINSVFVKEGDVYVWSRDISDKHSIKLVIPAEAVESNLDVFTVSDTESEE